MKSTVMINLVGLALALAACERPQREAFRPSDMASGAAAVFIDEPLVIRFNRALQETQPSPQAIVVKDSRGNLIRVSTLTDERTLVIQPLEGGKTWPVDSTFVDVMLPFPVFGAAVRSRDGEALENRFSARVAIAAARAPREGALTLIDSFPTDGARDIDFVSDASGQFKVTLSFDAAIDPHSLESGIQIVDTSRREVVEGVARRVDVQEPTRVIVEPFASGMLFSGDTTYEVRLTETLRTLDGRTLLAKEKLTFTTRKTGPNQQVMKVCFECDSDVDPRSRAYIDPVARVLRPRELYEPVVPAGDGSQLRSLLEGWDPAYAAPHPFSGIGLPSRTQILIPVEWLRPPGTDDDRASRLLITGLDFRAASDLKSPIVASDFQVTLGYHSRAAADSGSGLSETFDVNDDGGRRSKPIRLRNADRFVRLASPTQKTGAIRALHLEFDEPFVFDAAEGDLVLGIKNLGGVSSDLEPLALGTRGIAIEGFTPNDDRTMMVMGGARDLSGRTSTFHPFIRFYTLQIPPILTRWYVAKDLKKPSFFRDPHRLRSRGEAVEGRDFQVFYQGGTVVGVLDGTSRPGERSLILENDRTTTEPPTEGSDAVRLRIEFDPSLLLRTPSGPLPCIEYIPLGYREL